MTDKIDAFIKHKGLKGRREFAELCGIPYPTVVSFFSNGYGNAGRETLNKMKIVMGLTLDELADDNIDIDFATRNDKEQTPPPLLANGNVEVCIARDGQYTNYALCEEDVAMVTAFLRKNDLKGEKK